MANTDEIVVRAIDFKMAPDVEHYVQTLKKNGTLEMLSKEKNLNVDALKKTSLGKMCKIFEETVGIEMEPGDILIFGDSASFEIVTGEGFPPGQSP